MGPKIEISELNVYSETARYTLFAHCITPGPRTEIYVGIHGISSWSDILPDYPSFLYLAGYRKRQAGFPVIEKARYPAKYGNKSQKQSCTKTHKCADVSSSVSDPQKFLCRSGSGIPKMSIRIRIRGEGTQNVFDKKYKKDWQKKLYLQFSLLV